MTEQPLPAELEWLFDRCNDPLCALTPDGLFERVNSALADLLKSAASDLSRQSFLGYVHPEDRPVLIQALHGYAPADGSIELRLFDAEGSLHTLRWSFTRCADDLILGVATIVNTPAVVAGDRLLRLFETANYGIIIADAETLAIENVNAHLLNLIKCEGPEVRMHTLETLPALQFGSFGSTLVKELRTASVSRIESFLIDNDGARIPAEIIARVYDEGARRVIQCNVRDTSDRRAAQLALQESEERFRLLVEGVHDYALFMITVTGEIASWNIGAERLLGYKESEVIGKDLAIIFTPEDQQVGVPRLEIERAIRDGYSADDRWHIRKDRTRFFVNGMLTSVRGQDGELRGFGKLMHDVTEKRQTEEALRQAGKRESIGIMAGGIAHDFNNLLVGIMGGISFVRTTLAEDHPAYKMLQLAEQSSERAADLTRQLLAYAGKAHMIMAPLHLDREVEGILDLLRLSIPRKVELKLSLAKNTPLCSRVAAEIQQIVMNLVINATEEFGDSGGTITISTGSTTLTAREISSALELAQLKPGEYVYLEVANNCSGMDPATAAKICDPFFSTKFTGRGLGLAIVSGVVRSHKGAMTVKASPGNGSTFRVLFPAIRRPVSQKKAAVVDPDLQGSGTVLIVDDESSVLMVARTSLQHFGYTVLEASSGTQALAVARERGPEIRAVVLDLSMPGMGGDEVFPLLRTVLPDVPVVISSGFSNMIAGERFGSESEVPFLQKPYTAAQLGQTLKSLLHGGRERRGTKENPKD